MEATVNMPIVVQQRRQNDYTNANSDFSGFDLPLGLEVFRRGNEPSYRLVHRPNSLITFNDSETDSLKHSATKFAVLKDSAETTTFDADYSNSIAQNTAVGKDEDLDDSLFYGVQVIEHSQKVIFSQEVELKLNELEKWRPQITIDSFLLEDDE